MNRYRNGSGWKCRATSRWTPRQPKRGASSMAVAQTTWIAAFQTANNGVTINYSPDGSGAGRESFISGAVQFAGSDRAFNDTEMEGTFAGCAADSKALNLPVYISPIAIIFNVEGVEELRLTPEVVEGCSALLSITQYGSTRSINASAAAAIAMHSWVRQHADLADGSAWRG